MATIDPAKVWSLNYRLLMSVITTVAPNIAALGVETKELFLLVEVEAHPYPAELAAVLGMPKPTVTVYVKRLEAAGFLRREIDAADLPRHRLVGTPPRRAALGRVRRAARTPQRGRADRAAAPARETGLTAFLDVTVHVRGGLTPRRC